jgi:hypothetical protein
MPKLTGRCLCGRVQYFGEAEPLLMRACHCKNCQRFTGSAFLTVVAVPSASITITGDPKVFTQRGGTSGLPLHRRFCPECGSSLTVHRDDTGRLMIMAGTLDDTSFVKPMANIYCESKQAWVPLSQDIPSFPRAQD